MKSMTNILLRRMLAVVAMSCCISQAVYADAIDFESYPLGTIIDIEYAPQLMVSEFNGSSSPELGRPFGTNDSNRFNNYGWGTGLKKGFKKRWAKGLIKDLKKGWGTGLKKGFKKRWGKGLKQGVSSKVKMFDKDDNEILQNIFFTGGDHKWGHRLFGVDGVKHIELNTDDSGAIDNTIFTPAEMPPVPVPAALWLFGSGLIGLVGFARRKKAQPLNT